MERLFFLIITLLFITFLLSVAVGDVRELFNHHELMDVNENFDHNYDEVERSADDLYSSLEDWGNNKQKLYNFEKPGFGKQLADALNRVKYINSDLNREHHKMFVPDTRHIDYINKINSVGFNGPNEREKDHNYGVETGDFESKSIHTNVNGHKMSNSLKNGYKRIHNNAFRPRKRIFSGDKIGNHLGIDYNSDTFNNHNFESEYYHNYKYGGLKTKNNHVNKFHKVVVKKSNDFSENQLPENYLINSEQNNKSSRQYEDVKDKLLNKNNQHNKIDDSFIGLAGVENHLVNSDYQNNEIEYDNNRNHKGYFFGNKSDVSIENILTKSDQNNNIKNDNYKNVFHDKNNNSFNGSGKAAYEKLIGYSNRDNDFNNLVYPDSLLHASLKKNWKHYYKNKFLNKKLVDNSNKRIVRTNNSDKNNGDENNFVMIDDLKFGNNSSENGSKIKVKEEDVRGLSNDGFPKKEIQYERIEGRNRFKRKPNSEIQLLNSPLDGNKANKVSDARNNKYFQDRYFTVGDKFGRNNDDDKFNVTSTISTYLMDSLKSEFYSYSPENSTSSTVFGKSKGNINVKLPNNQIVSAPLGRCPILRMTSPSISGTDGDSELDLVVKLNRTGTDSEELNIAHVVSNFVANLLHNAGKTGNMRKELGLSKTYDRRYPFHVNKQVDDQLLAGLMNCISNIMEETLSNQQCSEMPSELKRFIDWLLLNGSSAHDQFKQFLSIKGCQQKSFLFPSYDVKFTTGCSPMHKSNKIFSSSTLTIRQRQDNCNKSPKIIDSLKKYIDIPSSIFGEGNNFQHLQDKNPYGLFKHYLTDKKISSSENNVQKRVQYDDNYGDNRHDVNNGITKNQIIDRLNVDNNCEYDNDFSVVGLPYSDYVSNYNYENRLGINKKLKKRNDYLSDFEMPIVYDNRDK